MFGASIGRSEEKKSKWRQNVFGASIGRFDFFRRKWPVFLEMGTTFENLRFFRNDAKTTRWRRSGYRNPIRLKRAIFLELGPTFSSGRKSTLGLEWLGAPRFGPAATIENLKFGTSESVWPQNDSVPRDSVVGAVLKKFVKFALFLGSSEISNADF